MKSFNPYSSGFSIYLLVIAQIPKVPFKASILIHLDFLSIQTSSSSINQLIKKLQSLFTWIFYLFKKLNNYYDFEKQLQSLFTWIFYLFRETSCDKQQFSELQSLFTWIFYLFDYMHCDSAYYLEASILIHLDFLSI